MNPFLSRMLRLLVVANALICTGTAMAQEALKLSQPEIRLWPNGAPGSEGKTSPETWNPSPDGFHRVTNINNPSITVFLPPKGKANGTAVVISPGGGHRYHVMDLEGSLVAERLNAMGIAAFVLKSRLAKAPESTYTVEGHSLPDAQRAIRLIRSRAAEWNIKTDRVGVMGFSAGGLIAELAATRFESVEPKPSDPIDSLSSRPDFAVLGYGGAPADRLTLPKNTPPMFLLVAGDDAPAAMLAETYVKLRAQKIPAELHIYSKGGHGFGMTGRTPAFRDLPLSRWPEQLQAWLLQIGMVAASAETAPNVLSDQEQRSGWRLLWDGKTSEGWRSAKAQTFPAGGWTMQGGVLTVQQSKGQEANAGGDIITREKYSNFELKVDFKITPGANSGIKYFVHPDLDPITGAGTPASVGSAIGYEYQVLDDALHPDAKLGRNGNRTLGSLYDLLPAAPAKKSNPVGQWNTALIIVRGNQVEHWLNGEKVLQFDRSSPQFREAFQLSKFKGISEFPQWTDGHILLQEHGNEVSYRNIKIRVLPEK